MWLSASTFMKYCSVEIIPLMNQWAWEKQLFDLFESFDGELRERALWQFQWENC